MPSYNLDLRDPQAVLRILVCLVEAAKGKELQFWAEDYDGQNTGKLLVVDYQKKKGIISLRVTSDNGAAVPVAPESHAWARPPEAAPLERHRVAAAQAAERHAVPTDEEMADLEEAAERNRNLAKAVEEGKTPLQIRVQK
jgi:hypothetical protein